jgi:hypothetical protein
MAGADGNGRDGTLSTWRDCVLAEAGRYLRKLEIVDPTRDMVTTMMSGGANAGEIVARIWREYGENIHPRTGWLAYI